MVNSDRLAPTDASDNRGGCMREHDDRSRRILPLTTINHGANWLRKRLGLLPQRIDDGEEGEAVEVGRRECKFG